MRRANSPLRMFATLFVLVAFAVAAALSRLAVCYRIPNHQAVVWALGAFASVASLAGISWRSGRLRPWALVIALVVAAGFILGAARVGGYLGEGQCST